MFSLHLKELVFIFLFVLTRRNFVETNVNSKNQKKERNCMGWAGSFPEDLLDIYHCGESKTKRKWFLDETRDGLVDENRINNQQQKKKTGLYTKKKSFCRSNLFQTMNNELI